MGLCNRVGKAASPTSALGTRQLLLTCFLGVPVCIKSRNNTYVSFLLPILVLSIYFLIVNNYDALVVTLSRLLSQHKELSSKTVLYQPDYSMPSLLL